jgi:hypothetical protein
MGEILRSERLENGLTVEFFDRSNRYFGDYHRVFIEVRCRIPLMGDVFAESPDPAAALQRARAVLGEEVVFNRTLEKMGVAGEEVERTRHFLIDSFLRSALSYLQNPSFPRRFIASELERRIKGRRPFWPRT